MNAHQADNQSFDAWRPKRIAIIGSGAMGSSLAAILGQITPVVMVCRRPERAAEIFQDGVRTHGIIEAHANPLLVRSINDLPTIGGVSLIFVATKTTAIPQVAGELRPMLDKLADQPGAPFIVSYQNGIEPGRQMIEMLGDNRVLRMVLSLGAVLAPGETSVEITMSVPPHSIGTLHPEHQVVCKRIAELLTRAGLETKFDDQIERMVWAKGVVNAAVNPVAALVNATVGDVLDSPSRKIVDALLAEGIAVATADGVDLGPTFTERVEMLFEHARPHVPSMVEDIRAGRESEVGQLNRQVIEFGARFGIPTPTHEIIDALIETFDWKVYHKGKRTSQTI